MPWSKTTPLFEIRRMARNSYHRNLCKKWNVTYQENPFCEICGKRPHKGPLNLDHDHKTGMVRGWLCSSCNTKLGWFERLEYDIQNYLLNCKQLQSVGLYARSAPLEVRE